MDTASTTGLARMIRAQPELVRAICVFNQNPADYIDVSRREDFFPQHAHGPVWTSERSRRHLSRHILHRIGVSPCLEPGRAEWPVALLDRGAIDRLARHVAAALVGARVRRSLSREEVLKWRDWLSPEAHDFALTRAGLLPIRAEGLAVPRDLAALGLGHAWIVSATRRWPQAISRRFMLKMPPGDFPAADAIDGAFASRLVHSVLAIVESRWCSSFATMCA
jgi:hypothetical protein